MTPADARINHLFAAIREALRLMVAGDYAAATAVLSNPPALSNKKETSHVHSHRSPELSSSGETT